MVTPPPDRLAREAITLQHLKENIKVLLVAGLTFALIVGNHCIVLLEATLYYILLRKKRVDTMSTRHNEETRNIKNK